MQVRFGKRKRIQFTDRSHPVMGILSVILGVVSLVILAVLCIVSGQSGGNAGIFAGIIGIMSMMISVVGFVMAVKCYRQEDIYMITPALGSVLNGMLVIVFLLLFFIGAV